MEIEVKLFGELKKYAPGDQPTFSITLAPEASVGDALVALKIPPDVERVTLLNGHRVGDEILLEPQTTLVLLPPISGG